MITLLDGVIEGGQPGRTTVQSQVIAMNEPGRGMWMESIKALWGQAKKLLSK